MASSHQCFLTNPIYMFRGLFKLYLLRRFMGTGAGRGRRRTGLGCGCLGIVVLLILFFVLLRGCAGGIEGYSW